MAVTDDRVSNSIDVKRIRVLVLSLSCSCSRIVSHHCHCDTLLFCLCKQDPGRQYGSLNDVSMGVYILTQLHCLFSFLFSSCFCHCHPGSCSRFLFLFLLFLLSLLFSFSVVSWVLCSPVNLFSFFCRVLGPIYVLL